MRGQAHRSQPGDLDSASSSNVGESSLSSDILPPLAYSMNRMKLPEEIREMFRRQGKIGGKKRLDVISAERRREIAKNAAKVRWRKLGRKKARRSNRKEKQPL